MVRAEEVFVGNVTAQVGTFIEQMSSFQAGDAMEAFCCGVMIAECFDACVKTDCCDGCCGCCGNRRGRRYMLLQEREFSDAELAAPIQLRIDDWAKQAAAGGALLEGENVAHMRSNFSKFFQNDRAQWLKEKALALLGEKFGADLTQLETCYNRSVDALERLVPEEEPSKVKATFDKDRSLFLRNVLNASARLVAAYGPVIAKQGLDLRSEGLPDLSTCGKALCSGSLQYHLTTTGIHECIWACPDGQRPDKFRMLQAAAVATMSPEQKKKIEDEMKSASKLSQILSVKTFVESIHFNWAKAFSDAPLRLWEQADLAKPTSTTPGTAFRYQGSCRTKALMVGDRVVRISDKEVGKVTRLSGTYGLIMKETIPEGSVEVEYKSGTVVQFVSALSSPYDVVSVPVPRDYAAWAIASNASALALDIPVFAKVPADADMMIWASAPPPKTVAEPPLQQTLVVDDPTVIKEQLKNIAADTVIGKPELLQRGGVAVHVTQHGSTHREKLD